MTQVGEWVVGPGGRGTCQFPVWAKHRDDVLGEVTFHGLTGYDSVDVGRIVSQARRQGWKVIGHRVADGGELVFDAERIAEPLPAPVPAPGDIPRWPHVFTIGAGVFLILLGFAVEGWDRWGGWGVGACAIGVGWLRLRRAAAEAAAAATTAAPATPPDPDR